MNTHSVPVRVEYFVRVEQHRDPGGRFARKQFQEGRQVLRAHVLRRQGGVAESVWAGELGKSAFGAEGVRGRRGALFVQGSERGAEETGQSVAKALPALIDATEAARACVSADEID